MQGGIQFLKELAILEMIYYNLTNVQPPTDPDKAQFLWPTGQQFVCSTLSLHPNWLAATTWRDKEAPAMDQVAQHLQQYGGEKQSCSLIYIYGSVSQLLTVSILLIKRKDVGSMHTASYPSVLPEGPLKGHEEMGWKWVAPISFVLEDSQYERFRHNRVKLPEQNII